MTSRCAYPWQQMNIDLTGEVVPCCFWSGYANSGKPLGNTNEQTLDEIWNGPAYRALRKANSGDGPRAGHPCHECLAWKWAGGTYPSFSWPVTFRPETGLCFTAPVPREILDEAARSEAPVHLLEDGVPLPIPDALHDDVRNLGAGRYSVWGETLYLSSSDGSDPRSSGRRYALRCGELVVELPSMRTDCESGRNLLAAHDEYERGVETMQARPSMVSFISTADCNIDCPACSQNTVRLANVRHRESTELEVLSLVPFLHQFVWHGGEPYLIRRFRAFVDGFRTEDNPNLTFGFTSNGTLLDADELDKLGRFPHVNASVSIDSFTRETFESMRAGANFDTVVANVLRAVGRQDDARFVVNVGMIVTKENLRELPDNLRFAFEHDIGLNLSPVVVYPVTARLDVFRDFHSEADGWLAALDEADEVIARARAERRAALRRVDPSGHVAALRQIVERAAARYRRVFPLRVVVHDPHGSWTKMRRPGLIVARDGEHHMPLAYAAFDRGPGEYTLMLPRDELSGEREAGWHLVHDLLEPMGTIAKDTFRDSDLRYVASTGYREMPAEVHIELPPFRPVPRTRNIEMVARGRAGEALHPVDPAEVYEAYGRMVVDELRGGRGLVLDDVDPDEYESYMERQARLQRSVQYRDFQSLLD
ncbi:MAG: SPASM domain-containing protein [Planctomycetes bacterium]|nr:SPASM domain-containing protein [Planctomycetota bacterium]